jgi:glutaredoxin
LTIEVYWRPGCSSCLRVKEFVSRAGVPFEAINVVEQPERALKVTRHGLYTPAVCVGDECVSGTGLDAVARLIGAPYAPPLMLEPFELKQRYEWFLDAACRYIDQLGALGLAYTLPGRDRPMLEVANQTVSVMRGFLAAYHQGFHDRQFARCPDDVRTTGDLQRRADETRALFTEWWLGHGIHGRLDRVIDTPWWGQRTLHEVFEREVWHTAQHTRQLMLALEQLGIAPDRPLTDSDFAGLQLPDAVHR